MVTCAIVDKKQFQNLPCGRSIINVKDGYRFVIIMIGEIEVEFREIEYIDMINTEMKTAIIGAGKASAAYMIAAAGISKGFPGVGMFCGGGSIGVAPGMREIETLKMQPMLFEDNMFHVKPPGITKEQRSIWRQTDTKKRWRK